MNFVCRTARLATVGCAILSLAAISPSAASEPPSVGAPEDSSSRLLDVLLTATSSDGHRTFLVVPKPNGDSPLTRDIEPSTVKLLIVAETGSPSDDATVLERFAREPSQGDTHLPLGFPEGVLAVDLHRPASFTPAKLKALVRSSNMETYAAFEFRERGKALYARFYAEFAAFKSAKTVPATLIGSIDAEGNFSPLTFEQRQ